MNIFEAIVKARNTVLTNVGHDPRNIDGFMDVPDYGEHGYGAYWSMKAHRQTRGKHGKKLIVKIFIPTLDSEGMRMELEAENGESWVYEGGIPTLVLNKWFAGARNWYEV